MPDRKTVVLAALLFLIAIAASAQTTDGPPPRAGDTVAWYTVRSGDTLIGITTHYLGSPSLWMENLRLNPQIHDTRHLKPGSRIRVVVARQLPKRNALVDRVARRVDAKPDPEPWATAHEGDLLKENDGLRTYEQSSADLKFDDGSHLTMTENSLLFLKEIRPAQRRPASETIEIIDGQIDLTSRPKKKAAAELHVLIGATSISHNATGNRPVATRSRKASGEKAQVMVYGGSSVVASAGKSVNVGAGMGTEVEQGKAPRPPQKLLPAPALVEPMAEPAAEATLRAGFAWKSVPDAASYTIEIFRDAGATQLVERATGLHETSWRPSALPYGDLYWRATAVNKTGLDGFPAKLVHFRSAAGLTGTVAEDRGARGNIDGAPPLAAVRLIAWRDDGNGIPDDDDVRASETRTDASGRFTFNGLAPAVYWIAADSLTIAPSNGFNAAAASESVWAEQTFGSAGAQCAGESGGEAVTRTNAGPCVGGRWAAQSDDPRKLSTSKHVVRVDTSDPAISTTVSFGFSFNVVDNDDDVEETTAGRSSQGSLRQFIRNANAVAGPNAMRFLPASAPSNGRWTIRCATPLPAVADRGTTLDGVAWMASDPGRPRTVATQQVPDLEVDVSGQEDALTLAAETTISSIALQSEGTAIRATAAMNARKLNVRSTAPAGVAAIVVDGRGSSIDQSAVDGGGRATAIVIESHAANVRISNTAVIHAANGIVIRAGSSDNSLLRDRFDDISGTAILFDPGAARPARNRISEAEFVSVGTLAGSTGKSSSAKAGACAYDDEAANRGIATPILFGTYERVPAGLGSLNGKACPGTTIEIYAESPGNRTTARFVKTVEPDSDGTFRVLDVIASARMLVNLTDKQGNTSMFYASEPPQAANGK
ncbi:MAG: FecR domain-containing protein [Acidobacteria bacterium]|nr:FecR domain-containing protein [Acidobacteriota bacterium]MBV9186283.1 FecR domain-containing protein [Acidobacteriota bacterium]